MGFLKKMLKKSIGGKIAAKLGDPLAKKIQGKKSSGGMAQKMAKTPMMQRTMKTGGPGQMSGGVTRPTPPTPRTGGMGDRIKPRTRNQQKY